ncbi:MAG TPA: Rieske (2Fe-2S) protein, partial [Kofleriaceae bacterium]|nr:Rieske (2Fe-2S) protein [Kofleriaceae bacterium]
MEADLQATLIRRVLAHLEQKTTDAADEPSTVPVTAYLDEARYAREHERLFRDLPLIVGHASQLARPGDFFTHDAAGVPLIVVRGEDGQINAFLNVCRHRGTRVEPAACGHRKAFVCPYHAWSYGCDGRLLWIPHEQGFGGIDRKTRGLVRVPATVAAGFVFVRPRPGDEPLELGDWVGSLAAELEGFGCAASQVYAARTSTRALSWKLAIDVFLE